MSGDLSAIRERTQETDTRIRTLRDEIDALRTTISNPALAASRRLRHRPPMASTRLRRPGRRPRRCRPPRRSQRAPPPSTAGLSPARMLESAKSDYYAGQWSLALSGFDALLRTFPRSESAGEAQFYIGETYYAQNKWREAIDAYGLVLQNYRTSRHGARRVLQARARLCADRPDRRGARSLGSGDQGRSRRATPRASPSRTSSASTAPRRRPNRPDRRRA